MSAHAIAPPTVLVTASSADTLRDDGQPWIEARCQGCQGPPGDLAPCPYAEELYGEDSPCNCCDECRRACAEDI